jgi:hypothetical protein
MRDVAHRKPEDVVSGDTATLRAAADLLDGRASRAIDDSDGDSRWQVRLGKVRTVGRRYVIAAGSDAVDTEWIATVDPHAGRLLAELLRATAADADSSWDVHCAALAVARAVLGTDTP